MRSIRFAVLVASVATLVVSGLPAEAGHKNDPRTKNIHPLGHIEEPASLVRPEIGNTNIHTDIAFWENLAIQGAWVGFNIRDISSPGDPRQISFTSCAGNQGDVLVWDNIVVRSWNTPAGTPGPFGAGLSCDGEPVPAGWEGVHVFDISNLSNPVVVDAIETECGSHTATAVPDPANNRLLVYSSSSGAACPWIDIIEVPLDDPGNSSLLRTEPSDHTCHDIGVILGDAMKASCAGGPGMRVFSLGGANGGSLEDPALLFHVEEPGVTIGHSAAWSWDGEVIVFGHEPGGGINAECEASDADVKKSFFFYDGDTGAKLGQWTLTRAQGPQENCTLHNYNIVPLRSGRDVLVHGSYQSGTAVLDFTDPSNAVELGWSDPPVIPVPAGLGFCQPAGCDVAGAWSSYWYNNFIYETNISEGLNVFRFSGNATAGAMRLDHLNPQTQEFTLG